MNNVRSEVKYLVLDGFVTSATDGQRHYVSAARLMGLYNVSPDECLVWNSLKMQGYDRKWLDSLARLHPKSDGDYRIPERLGA